MSNISASNKASNEEAVDMDALQKAFEAIEQYDLEIGTVLVPLEAAGDILTDAQIWKVMHQGERKDPKEKRIIIF